MKQLSQSGRSAFTVVAQPLGLELASRIGVVVSSCAAIILLMIIWRVASLNLSPALASMVAVSMAALLVIGAVRMVRSGLIALPKTRTVPSRAKKIPPNWTQVVRRSTIDGGIETIEGWQRVQLGAGQRQAIAHLSFCPPLTGTPTVSISTDAQSKFTTRCKVTHAWPHGMRLEVKLGEPPRSPISLLVQFVAQSGSK